jgi:hypothetical protein
MKNQWIPDRETLVGFGIEDNTNGIRTQLMTLLEMAREQGPRGIDYAFGLKIGPSVHVNQNGAFKCYDAGPKVGFEYLVGLLLREGGAISARVVELLLGDYAWANRYLPGSLRQAEPTDSAPICLPVPHWEVLHALVGDFKGKGVIYALRYFTAPIVVSERSRCANSAYLLREFAGEVLARRDQVGKWFEGAFKTPEFAPFAYLLVNPSQKQTNTPESILEPS